MFAAKELVLVLADAWRAADLARRLRSWWWVVTHRRVALDESEPARFQVAYISPGEVRDVLAQHGWTSPPHGRHKGRAAQ